MRLAACMPEKAKSCMKNSICVNIISFVIYFHVESSASKLSSYFFGCSLADGRGPKHRAHAVSASPVLQMSASVLLEIVPHAS